MVTKGKDLSLYFTLTLPHRVSGPSIKHHNWEYPPPSTMWYLMTCSPLCGTWERAQSQEIGKTGRGSLISHYAGKFHSRKIVASQRILKHAPIQASLARKLAGSSSLISTSRVWSPGCTQQYDRRSCTNTVNRVHIRYYKPLHCIVNPSIIE